MGRGVSWIEGCQSWAMANNVIHHHKVQGVDAGDCVGLGRQEGREKGLQPGSATACCSYSAG
jgi:hypothetical protein